MQSLETKCRDLFTVSYLLHSDLQALLRYHITLWILHHLSVTDVLVLGSSQISLSTVALSYFSLVISLRYQLSCWTRTDVLLALSPHAVVWNITHFWVETWISLHERFSGILWPFWLFFHHCESLATARIRGPMQPNVKNFAKSSISYRQGVTGGSLNFFQIAGGEWQPQGFLTPTTDSSVSHPGE